MNVLVLNSGSSSLKFQIIQSDLDTIRTNTDHSIASGLIERIQSQSLVTLRSHANGETRKFATPLRDHRAAVDLVLRTMVDGTIEVPGIASLSDIHAVGHRVVHGGERFTSSVIINDEVLKHFEDLIDLAPLHNPANIMGIRAARDVLGRGIPQVAVFDTAFHHTLPETAFLYAIPYQLYRRHKIRRYGFHGTSHRYVAYRYRQLTGIPRDQTNAITIHLGNGASACAILHGDSIETSMGMTPLEGLVMGTRSGDLDPAVLEFIADKEGLTLHQVDTMLNSQSGLLGVSGLTNDMRELLEEMREHKDRRATLAVDLFCHRIRKYIGAYVSTLVSTDPSLQDITIIFTGGIGENSPEIRRRVCQGLGWFGLSLDPLKNEQAHDGWEGEITTTDGTPAAGNRLKVFVIPTNEELLIARDTVRAINREDQEA